MSYNKENLNLNDINAKQGLLKLFQYTEKSDSLATIGSNGYFVPTSDQYDKASLMEVGDVLMAEGSDGTEMFYITSLDPITVNEAGGGGAGFEVIVNTEEELLAALASNKRNIAILSDITLSNNLVFPENKYYIYLDAVLTVGDYVFDVGSHATSSFYFYGASNTSSAIIFAAAGPHPLFINDSGTNELFFYNLILSNQSVENNARLTNNAVTIASFCSISNGSGTDSGVNLTTFDSQFNHCTIGGSFTMADRSIITGGTIEAGTLTLTGASRARIMGVRFNNATITIDVSTEEASIVGCSMAGTSTFTDNGTDTHKAGNNNVIGNSYISSNSGTLNTNWNGIFGGPKAGNIEYEIVGNVVHLTLPETAENMSSSGFITNETALPADLRPLNDKYTFIITEQDNVKTTGLVWIEGTNGADPGRINIYQNITGGNFSGAPGVSGGFLSGTITYGISN